MILFKKVSKSGKEYYVLAVNTGFKTADGKYEKSYTNITSEQAGYLVLKYNIPVYENSEK